MGTITYGYWIAVIFDSPGSLGISDDLIYHQLLGWVHQKTKWLLPLGGGALFSHFLYTLGWPWTDLEISALLQASAVSTVHV